MKKNKAQLCMLLAGCILCAGMAACSEADPNASSVTTQQEETAEASSDRPALNIPDTTYEGEKIVLMGARPDASLTFSEFAYDEERKGEVVNDAVQKRNTIVENQLGVKIVNNDINYNEIGGTLQRMTASQDGSVDVYTPQLQDILSLIAGGYLVNLYDMPVMDIDNPWWDQAMNRDLAMNGRLYMQAGDIVLAGKEMNCFMTVNHKLLADNNLELPYQIVLDGSWTLDKMYEMCSDLTRDLNGDNKLNQHDQFGYTHTASAAYWNFVAAGGCIAQLNSEGVPTLMDENLEKNITILEKINQIYGNPNVFYDVDKMPNSWTTNQEMFINDQIAFRPASIYNLQSMRNMNSNFGILPYPKLEESAEYRSSPTSFRIHCITVSTANTRQEMTGTVLEALAYYSKDTTVEAYYDTNLQGIVSRDEESRAMLDIIFNNVVYDLIETYRWGSMFDAVCSGIRNPGVFASSYESAKRGTVRAMEKAYAFYVSAME